MAFSTGSSSGTTAEINVTPLIDVLLVLLIIFMVIVPVMPRGLSSLLPQPPKEPVLPAPLPLVLAVSPAAGGGVMYELNQRRLDKPALEQSLKSVMATRQDKVLFVKADRSLEFSVVAEVIGLAHGASADHIGILTPGVEAGR